MNEPEQASNILPLWRFVLPLLLQTALILAVPARAFMISITGQTVILQTQPVDPYDLLRGYSQTLRYTISNTGNLKELDGWQELSKVINQKKKNSSRRRNRFTNQGKIYVILEAPKNNQNNPPLPWKAIAVSLKKPLNLAENQIAIQGIIIQNSVIYGLEKYYFPEAKKAEINSRISRNQRNREESFVVEIKVDKKGQAVPISLWLGKQNYQF